MKTVQTSLARRLALSIPRKHHYVPVFYLKQWTGTDGRLCEYKNSGGQILTRQTFPAGTGYERDLYRVEGLPDALAHVIESKFMHMVDTEANYARCAARRMRAFWRNHPSQLRYS
jgi:hypothetical protein